MSKLSYPEEQIKIAKQILLISRTFGYLSLTGHNIPFEDIQEIYRLGQQFFHLPDAEKDPWQVQADVGYQAPSKASGDGRACAWLSGKPGVLSANAELLPPFWWPHIERLEAFKQNCQQLVLTLLHLFAVALDLKDEDTFVTPHTKENPDHVVQCRLTMYPTFQNMVPPTDAGALRMTPRSQSGSVTLLFCNLGSIEVEAPSGEWIEGPHIDGAVHVVLGDAIPFWSRGQMKATRHRINLASVPYGAERISCAYFSAADKDAALEPLAGSGKRTHPLSDGHGL